MLYDEEITSIKGQITSNLISFCAYIVLLCACILLIMRSSIMLRIKEIGIYRAIGVTKKNLMLKFATESFVLTCGTVLPGFILSSILITTWLNNNTIAKEFFYYPTYFAFSLLGLILVIGVFSGILPLVSLLRKTPSQIISKYDI